MKRLLIISVFVSAVAVVAHGQVIDTTRNINTWMLKHNFTRFEDVQLDTGMHQLQRDVNPAFSQGFAYESLGIQGNALNHVDFMLRQDPGSFLLGRAFEPYLKTAERTVFFNTKSPFTALSFSTMPLNDWKEDNVEIMHSQNASAFTNFGIDFNILSSKPLYTNQKTTMTRTGLFGSHARNKYSFFGTFYYNDTKAGDNGGIQDREAFLDGVEEEFWLYPVNLGEANSHYRNLALFASQKYNLVEGQTSTDSLGNTIRKGKTLSLSWQLSMDRQLKDYTDVVDPDSLSPVYSNYYYLAPDARDSASEDRISNVFQVILGDPDYDKISARIFAGHEWRRYGMLSPETIAGDSLTSDTIIRAFQSEAFNDIKVGFHLAGPTTGKWDWVIDGNYYLLGYQQNNFNLHTTFSRELGGKANLGLRGSFELTRPNYFTNYYSSSFFKWDNDFPAMRRIMGEAFIQSNALEMDIRLRAASISNYIYWDAEALPRIYDKELLVFSAHLSKHFQLAGFNSEDKLLIQYSSEKEVLNLPLIAVYSSNYWKQSLFKGALVTDIGFDIYYTTKYLASNYMPASGVFHLQDKAETGGYPFLDVFVAFRVKTTRIFVSYNNVLQSVGAAGNNFFTAYPYPMKPRFLKLGIVWYFYD